MTAPMAVIELAVMRAMYLDRKLDAVFASVGALAPVMFWRLIRQQAAVSHTRFLRSMIPHHAAAILMCEQASIQDPSIKDLCRRIVTNQPAEIDRDCPERKTQTVTCPASGGGAHCRARQRETFPWLRGSCRQVLKPTEEAGESINGAAPGQVDQ